MNQTHQVVRQDARDAPRDAAVTMAEEKPDRTLVAPLNSVSYTGLEEPFWCALSHPAHQLYSA